MKQSEVYEKRWQWVGDSTHLSAVLWGLSKTAQTDPVTQCLARSEYSVNAITNFVDWYYLLSNLCHPPS